MLDRSISQIMQDAISNKVFPGGVVGYIKNGRSTVLPFGRHTYDSQSPMVTDDTVYDLASVTKVIPTNSIILKLIEEGKLSEGSRVVDYLPKLSMPSRETILVKHLLTFTAVVELQGRLSSFAPLGADGILQKIYQAPLLYPSGTRYQYHNVVSLLLGLIIEKITKRPLNKVADEMIFNPLGMSRTTFYPHSLPTTNIAPTEINARGLVQAVPHDETAWAFYQEGRVAGHAGLFSCAADLLTFGQMLLNNGQHAGKQYFNSQTLQKIQTEIFNNGEFGMTLGWEINQSDYMSPAIAPGIYGKDGFTGTLILIDPESKRCLVMLTNRTFPGRPPNSEQINKVRHKIQEAVFN